MIDAPSAHDSTASYRETGARSGTMTLLGSPPGDMDQRIGMIVRP
jgi:hypothetical protein